ncbi:hypothetical protein AMECASPLE_019265, partial [Ameca splendens]
WNSPRNAQREQKNHTTPFPSSFQPQPTQKRLISPNKPPAPIFSLTSVKQSFV